MKNKPLFILWFVFALVNLVDLITAYFILPGESNPIYLLTQSYLVLIFVKVFIVGLSLLIVLKNTFPNRIFYYGFVLCLMLGTVLVGLGAHGNIRGIKEPQIVEEASQLSNEIKSQHYYSFVTILYIIPVIFCLITFVFYDYTFQKVTYENEQHTDSNRNANR